MHFALLASFDKAAKCMMQHHKVYVSASTSRRQTEAIGACAEHMQNEQAKSVLHQSNTLSLKKDDQVKEIKQVISSDGSFISLRRKVYTEVKTAVIGEVEENTHRSKLRPEQEVRMTNITYFSRMAPSETFTELSIGETNRRGFLDRKQVCAVSDGAEWIQHFVDAHRADAVRILDFYHATEYLSDIATLVRDAGTKLKDTWFDEQCHELKHYGPKKVLEEIHRLLREHPQIEELKKKVNYLQKREQMMQYPQFRASGWPIGSGSAESSQTCVVQSRMKGPGMHWEGKNVNPMLALRTGMCNDRWNETRDQAFLYRLARRQSSRFDHQKKRYEVLEQQVKEGLVRLIFLSSLHQPKTTKDPIELQKVDLVPPSSCIPHDKKACHPAQSHPWRQYRRAKK
jgi:hypothetical protein